MQKLRKNIV